MVLQLVEPGQNVKGSSTPGVVVGIDLGTTHSAVAIVEHSQPRLLNLKDHGPLLPSLLSIGEDTFLVGKVGKETLSSTKRLMGRGLEDPVLSQFPEVLKGDPVRLKLGEYALTPVEVASHILSTLKSQVEDTCQAPLEGAVITVPAYFDEAARVATKQAAALAGIRILRLLNEPTAAALAYGLEAGAEGIYAIYDFGGGTFDLSLLKLQDRVFQVLATGGDLTLGGDDIDRALAVHLQKLSSLRGSIGAVPIQGQEEMERIASLAMTNKARKIKEHLSQVEIYEEISRQDLNELARPFVERTLMITKQVMRDARLSPHEIKGVVLVGGMTRMPLVRKSVKDLFQKEPLHDIDPDHAVALGAALSAHGLTHGADTLLLDVTPLSLGLETMGGLVEKIIPRNTPLPALASQEFTTHQDGQGGMMIHIVQGEREFVKDCLSLARFELKGLPSLPAGQARVRVDFAVDVEGLLTVSALEKTTGLSQHVEVRPSSGLDEKTLQHMILESQKHGREDILKRMQVENNLKAT